MPWFGLAPTRSATVVCLWDLGWCRRRNTHHGAWTQRREQLAHTRDERLHVRQPVALGDQDNNTQIVASHILLVFQVLIAGNEGVKLPAREFQQLTIALPLPALFRHCAHLYAAVKAPAQP